MSPWVSAMINATPWAAVAVFAISKLYRLAVVWLVRSGRSDMFVDEGRLRFTARRGRPDPHTEPLAEQRGLRSVGGDGVRDGPAETERARSG